jgi:hypothetical protein
MEDIFEDNEAVIGNHKLKKTDHTMSKINRIKAQTIIYKTVHRKRKMEQVEPHKKGR